MKITCHSCGAKYTVSDDKIQGKTVKMKCRKCSATIVVGNAQADGSAGGGDAGSPPPGSFLVNVADGDQRTMTAGEIADAYRAGTITDDTYVWADGMSDWQTVLENPEVAAAIGGGGGVPAAAPSFAGVPDFESPAAAEPARAARKESRASRDLFAEAVPAAAASSGGLFGSSSMGSGGGSTAMVGDTGKRDENSVLFSLSALTSVEASAPVGKTTAKKDDSGLIDLKALALSAPTASSASSASDNLLPDAAAVFPLGMPILAPPPQAAPAVGMDVAAPPQKSKVGIIVAGAVAIVAMVLVFFLVKGTPPAAPCAHAGPDRRDAASDHAGGSDASAERGRADRACRERIGELGGRREGWRQVAAEGQGHGGAGRWSAARGGRGNPPKPPPAKSKCGCAANDLMCNMKCSAGGK